MKKNLKSAGFTLIELLAVITIMGILMMVAIPSVSRTIENSRRDTFADVAKQYINTIRDADGKYILNIGTGAYLSAGAKIIGNSSIGDWCTVGVNTVLHNKFLPNRHLAYNDYDGKLIIKKHDNM